MISILILIIIITITILLLFSNFFYSNFQTVPTVEQQKIANDEFLESYKKIKKKQEEQNKDKIPYTWNENNTLESMKLEPCLSNIDENIGPGRLTCYSAPPWWYPFKKYDENNFKSTCYLDRYNPIYNYLGNAQEMFWDFKSVKDTYNEI